MKYESAELTKISINILLASTVTTSNMLASACEKISADLDKQLSDVGYNVKRIINTERSIIVI